MLDSRNTLNTVPTLEPCKDFRFFPRIDLIRYPLAFWAGAGERGLMFAPLPLKKLNDRSYRDGYASIKLFVDRTIPVPFLFFFSFVFLKIILIREEIWGEAEKVD